MKILKKLPLILILSFLFIITQISCDSKEQVIEPSTETQSELESSNGQVIESSTTPTQEQIVNQIPWSNAESNGWANPLGEGKELIIITGCDFDSSIYLNSWGRKHMGIDIDSEEDDDVYPIAGGTISKIVRGSDTMKMVVIIKHTNLNNEDFFVIYGHVLARSDLEKDSKLEVGEKIGNIKKAGTSPHLHFGINISSKITDFMFKNSDGEWGWGRIPAFANPSDYGWVDPIDYLDKHLPLPSLTSEESQGMIVEEVTDEPEEEALDESEVTEVFTEHEPLLSIVTTSLSSGTVGVSYNLSLLASGGKTPYSWSIVSGNLPSGLNLNTSGIISGTPTTAGTYNFTVQVRDSSSSQQTDLKELSINIADGTAADTTAPTVNSLSVTPSSVTLGSSFTISYSVSDTGGSGLNRVELWRANGSGGSPVGWVEVKRTLASGNSYSGSFSDTPSSGGTYWYGIHVVDNTGNWTPESSPVKVTVTASTLYVSLVASPSSGTAPLNVNLTATVSGTATGTINYTFYSNRSDSGTNITSGWVAKFDGVTDNPKTAVCNYSSPGTYTAKVIVERGSAPPAEARVTITVSTAYDKEVTVANTSGIGVKLRSGPGLTYNKITALPEGTKMYVIDGPVQADGYTWWQITGTPGTGWSAVGEWLSPAPQVNTKVTVTYTGGISLRLRKTASLSATILKTLPGGTQMNVFSGPIQADGYTWWALQGYVGGNLYTGWSAVGNWLVPNPRY